MRAKKVTVPVFPRVGMVLMRRPNSHKLEGLEMADTWKFYTDPSGDWRWRRIASNGRIVGASTEGYRNKADCIANARRNGYRG